MHTSCELLEEHGHSSHNHTAEHSFRLEERADSDELQLESVPCGKLNKMWPFFRSAAFLEYTLRLDLKELKLNELIILGQTAQAGKDFTSFRLSPVVDEPSWAERHEQHAYTETETRDQLKADRDQPSSIRLGRTSAADVVRAVIYPEAHHDSTGDGELLERNKAAADFRRGHFGVVIRDVDRQGTNSKTGNKTTPQNARVTRHNCHTLYYHPDDEDADIENDGVFAR